MGILCALFIPDLRRDDVIWVFVAALGCTLLSIWLFARFCNQGRKSAGFLPASYLAWFVALGTYTLQAGAISRGILHLVSEPAFTDRRRYRHPAICCAVSAFPDDLDHNHAAVPGAFGNVSPRVFVRRFEEIRHEIFWLWVRSAGPLLMAAVFAVLTPLAFFLIHAGDGVGDAKPSAPSLGFALLIGACVVAPTVAVESMSVTWFPGSRWPMLLQFWTPLTFCIVVFGALLRAPDRTLGAAMAECGCLRRGVRNLARARLQPHTSDLL